MHTVDLTIGEYVHHLPMTADEDALLAELTDAVHSGGGIVVLPTEGEDSTVAVLISPGVPVLIERRTIQEDAAGDKCSPGDLDLVEWFDL